MERRFISALINFKSLVPKMISICNIWIIPILIIFGTSDLKFINAEMKRLSISEWSYVLFLQYLSK